MKQFTNMTHAELVDELRAAKAEIQRKNSALKRIANYAKAGNVNAVKSAAGIALKPKEVRK